METIDDVVAVLSNGTYSPAYIAAWLSSDTETIIGLLESRPDLFRVEGSEWKLVARATSTSSRSMNSVRKHLHPWRS